MAFPDSITGGIGTPRYPPGARRRAVFAEPVLLRGGLPGDTGGVRDRRGAGRGRQPCRSHAGGLHLGAREHSRESP